MVIRRWLSGDTAQLAENLVRDFHDIYPAALVPLSTSRAKGLREQGIKRLLASVAEIRLKRPIGIFRRIVFARAFQRALKAHGYPAAFNREVVVKVLVRLSLGEKKGAEDRS